MRQQRVLSRANMCSASSCCAPQFCQVCMEEGGPCAAAVTSRQACIQQCMLILDLVMTALVLHRTTERTGSGTRWQGCHSEAQPGTGCPTPRHLRSLSQVNTYSAFLSCTVVHLTFVPTWRLSQVILTG